MRTFTGDEPPPVLVSPVAPTRDNLIR